MDTIFINTENGRTSEYHVLLLNLTNKIYLRSEKTAALSNLSICYTWKNIKINTINTIIINSKYLPQLRVKNLSYLMDHIQYLIFKIILSIFLKNILKMLIIHQLEYM